MTYVGKILVIAIMALSLMFLALSTVVFMTERNWKDKAAQIQDSLNKANAEKTRLTTELQAANNNREAVEKDREAKVKQYEADLKLQEDAVKARQAEITAQRTSVETAQETTRSAMLEAEARLKETALLREQIAAVQKQANDFKLQQTELNDKIRLLERELEVARTNNKSLRDRVVTLSNVIQQNGLDPDPARYRALELPPDVEGEVTRVDGQNRRFEISIGSDDGLTAGHELMVYRLQPNPEYLGKVRVQTVAHDTAVVSLLGSTPQGKQIREGDIVSTKIRTR